MKYSYLYVLLSCVTLLTSTSLDASQRFTSDSNSTPFMIELYTSQGCSSCPPAEKAISDLLSHPNLFHTIFPLAYHVQYWDYIGWDDPFAKPTFDARHKYYASQNKVGVYTPAFFVDGTSWASQKPFPSPTQKHGTLDVTIQDSEANIIYTPDSPKPKKVTLSVALVGVGNITHVKRGENRNKSLPQDFIVLDLASYPDTPNHTWSITIPKPSNTSFERYAAIVWVKTDTSTAPLQVTGGWITP